MKRIFIVLFSALLVSVNAFAAFNALRPNRDIKPNTQAMLEKQTISAPVLADVDRLKDDQASNSGGVTTISTFLAQPDVTRNVTVTTGGTTADCAAGNVTVAGTNIFGNAITDTLAITANQAGTTSGTKAFKTVTSVAIPAQDDDGCTYDVGVGDVLGLKRCMAVAGDLVFATFDGAYESTRPTCVADADEVEKNTCDINGTLNGSKDVVLYFIQNWGCLP